MAEEDSSVERKTWQFYLFWKKESLEVRSEGVQGGFLWERMS